MMNLNVGTSGFSYREWKGGFYPEKITPGEMLRFYAERFGTVEINTTFYRMPTEETLTSWAEQVPEHFIFAFKAPRIITHLKRLRNVEEETAYLFRTLSILKTKLGPVLFQFPGTFHVDPPLLARFLTLIPAAMHCAFEFRSKSPLDIETLDMLSDKDYSLCVADTDDNPTSEITSTASWGYLRLRRSGYTYADLSLWRDRVRSQKWKNVFLFFKHEEKAKGPEIALRFRQLIQGLQNHD
ncbi:MAG TPA: DUF72 domain-containing protein [Syntrophorhabdales bacterium]|nr:DUF72 domain-containing protein [Syntrophorhabdales bacterium]